MDRIYLKINNYINFLYNELAIDLGTQLARKETTAAAQREWFLRHTHCTSRYRFEPAN
jgi:hypothetical protein